MSDPEEERRVRRRPELESARLITRKENVFKAAQAAQELFLSSSIESKVRQRRKPKSLSEFESETQMSAARAEKSKRKRCIQTQNFEICLTGTEIYEGSVREDQTIQDSSSKSSDCDFAIGDPIFVLWENHIWYPATCIRVDNQSVEFRWLDPGKYAATGSTDLKKVRRRIIGSVEISVGTQIYAKWSQDGCWYPAKFLSKHANSIRFEWESRGEWEAEDTVELSHVRVTIQEALAVKLNPMLLTSEDAVRRFTKDISTANRPESVSKR